MKKKTHIIYTDKEFNISTQHTYVHVCIHTHRLKKKYERPGAASNQRLAEFHRRAKLRPPVGILPQELVFDEMVNKLNSRQESSGVGFYQDVD